MSTFAAVGSPSRTSDWIFVVVVLLVCYLIIYPVYIFSLRYQKSRRIKNQLVTSTYKLPAPMTPTEFAYIFSSKVKRPQLYATLLDLANRSVLQLHRKEGKPVVDLGPKIDDNLNSFELMLITPVQVADREIDVNVVLEGRTNYTDRDKKPISGTKNYVYWWLLRDRLRERGIIEKRMSGRYSKMLLLFGAGAGLLIAVVSLVSWRFSEMLIEGKVDFGYLFETKINAFWMWLILVVPLLITSFFLLRLRGKMLGRSWLLTDKYKRYQGQLISFHEFVRLTNKGKLKFESKELETESRLQTRPYAIALGYEKE
jgi:hypothetical protein